VLVEQPALELAEEQCLADADVRARQRERARERRADEDVDFQQRMAKEITRLFPNCPPARALDENAVTLAVVASVRHDDTPYDELLMAGVPRHYARDQIRDAVDQVLDRWRA
jgi:hypothetical protein